jgi:dual specificity tyrosine-phosphorylation-regulated kinase 2/3/4
MAARSLTPQSALRTFSDQLTTHDQQEILSYTQVYFVGTKKAAASSSATTTSDSNNNGFDDEHHAYRLTPHDHIAYRFEILKILGKGSFGQASEIILSRFVHDVLMERDLNALHYV